MLLVVYESVWISMCGRVQMSDVACEGVHVDECLHVNADENVCVNVHACSNYMCK